MPIYDRDEAVETDFRAIKRIGGIVTGWEEMWSDEYKT